MWAVLCVFKPMFGQLLITQYTVFEVITKSSASIIRLSAE
ncbi:hypothetical protein PROVALCAL_00887 [Providencia alcalifaciens DSM 30120]|uniref:Uncharacterized protein n=1 Tax=Providencia alcalifaciens DSM 30120 TaxID=520999 RepID=B6XC26_9GAMM|nr:hypothetical protein PROVALCAL_00887 [Providencia alcalifaciens DSM 30120]